MSKSHNNLLLRLQKPHYIGNYRHFNDEYSDEVLFAHPLIATENRKGSAQYFHVLRLNGGNNSQIFIELESYQNSAGEYKISLTQGDILKEFYSVEEFKRNAKPLMCKAKLTPSDEFRYLLNGNFRSKRFKLKKMFPENETYDLIASDGQHLLVKKDKDYVFLPCPYCDKASWQIVSTSTKTPEEITKSMNREINKACDGYAKKFSLTYGVNAEYMAKYFRLPYDRIKEKQK